MKFALAALSVLALAAPAIAQPARPPEQVRRTIEALVEQGRADEAGLGFVEGLTTEVGQRLAGSEAEARARDWAVAELRGLGFEKVRVEPFEIPFWSRVRDDARIVSPAPQDLVITALGGSAATPEGGVTADIVRFPSMQALRDADGADVAGRIVFIDEPTTRTQDGSGYGFGVRKRRDCASVTDEKGGLACLIRSVGTQTRRFPHTGIMARDGALGAGPAAALSPPDADQLARLLALGPVTVSVDIQVETKTAAPSGNVIAEIAGAERPREIVLLGCHLDSWDLGTGAIDDGAGCGIIVGAAKLILDLPADQRPARTIRLVLYGAEEVGLLGAQAYARAHGDELGVHVFASESDFGADRIWRFDTRFGEGAVDYAAAFHTVLAPLGVVPGGNAARGGPDIGVLRQAGVPVASPVQNGSDYFDLHHTPDDTFDKIEPAAFRQNVSAYAAMAYLAAATDWNFRAPSPGAATE